MIKINIKFLIWKSHTELENYNSNFLPSSPPVRRLKPYRNDWIKKKSDFLR